MVLGAPNHSATGAIFPPSSFQSFKKRRPWKGMKETRCPLRGLGQRHNLLSYVCKIREDDREEKEKKEKCSENSGWLIQTITPFYLCLIDYGISKRKESHRVKRLQGSTRSARIFIFLTPTTTIDHWSSRWRTSWWNRKVVSLLLFWNDKEEREKTMTSISFDFLPLFHVDSAPVFRRTSFKINRP